MSKPVFLCDANIVIRLLQWDHEKLSPIAKEVFAKAEAGDYLLYFTSGCIAEIVWVLTSYYEQDRKHVARILSEFLQRPGIRLEHAKATLAALDDLQTKSVDYLDAFQARFAIEKGYAVMSFDRDFKKWPELGWQLPEN
ncbi:PIN domain-containing protein [Cerasicoccus maritimus]|uniref:PIN domain-containing protein n=1 Tax=Cerasicoccus maritimus TaxID=490089 RepID=UPI002852B0BC|nr:PIN domain-containing protein [Cerasicoccus maritimus]